MGTDVLEMRFFKVGAGQGDMLLKCSSDSDCPETSSLNVDHVQ